MLLKKSLQLLLLILMSLFICQCAAPTLFSDHWDTASMELFERKSSPYSNSPDAVVVFDLERMTLDSHEWDIVRERHVRIQIFTEEGKENADISIPYWHAHKVTEIKAQTILPDGRRVKLNPEDIFEEGNDKRWMYKKFALPGVEDQCIIEYQYKYRATNIAIVQPKYFQGYLYTEYSQFSMTLTQGFEYTASTKNVPPDFKEPERLDFDTPYEKNLSKFTWEFHDIPPLRNEYYMYNREDHLFSISMQMVRYVDPYNNITFIKEWEDLLKRVLEDDDYDSYMVKTGPLKKLLAEIEAKHPEQELQPRDIFLFVRDNFTRGNSRGMWPDQPMYDVIKDRQGNAVSKNLLLTSLLRLAGFKADPVLVSKRSNGVMNRMSPSIDDFNHLITQINLGGDILLLDAGSRYSTYQLMPLDNFSGIGLLVKDGAAQFIQFPTLPETSKRTILTTCKLDENGSLSGSFAISSTAYYASRLRAKHADAKDDLSFAYDEIVDHIPGIVVDSVTFDLNMDDLREPVLSTVYFQIPEYFVPVTGLNYLPTTFYQAFRKNYLVNENRNHPIEFSKPFRIRETVKMTLPDNFSVVETPKVTSIAGPGIAFQKRVMADGQNVEFSWNHQIIKLVHPPVKYEQLKTFYTEAVATDQAVLVLKQGE